MNHQCDELRQELAALQGSADSIHSNNAKLQVTVATLESQISSLSTQHTALQLANSQLVAEKDEVNLIIIVTESVPNLLADPICVCSLV
jgi:phage shock protein A